MASLTYSLFMAARRAALVDGSSRKRQKGIHMANETAVEESVNSSHGVQLNPIKANALGDGETSKVLNTRAQP